MPNNAAEILDVAGKGLDTLPSAWLSTPSLRELRAGFNRLHRLPAELSACTKLEALHLNHNLLGELPSSLSSCASLRVLNLSAHPLARFPESIAQLSNLESLHLRNTALEAVSPHFRAPAGLMFLSLAQNNISALPEGCFHSGGQLRILDLSRNRLRLLPSLSNLREARELDLSYNQLEHLPDDLCELENLEVLRLQGNRLQLLPAKVG